jgi:hypothetical protein
MPVEAEIKLRVAVSLIKKRAVNVMLTALKL